MSVSNDLSNHALLICDLPVDHDPSFMVWEQVVPAMLCENGNRLSLFTHQSERPTKLGKRLIHQFNAQPLAWIVEVTDRVGAKFGFGAAQVSGEFGGPFLFQLTRECGDGKHAP